MAVAEVISFPKGPEAGLNKVEHTEQQARLGRAMEIGADVLVGVRAVSAVAIKHYIESTPDYQSWGLALAFAAAAATDAVDGWLAKTGRRMQDKDESVRRPHKSYPDQLADKAIVDTTVVAIAKREKANGNHLYAGAVAAVGSVYITRDVLVTADRVVADIQDIDSRAQKKGKMKAVKQFLVIGAALSPLAKSSPAKAVVSAGLAYTVKESVVSGIDLHKSFRQQRQKRASFRASQEPDKGEIRVLRP